MKVDVGLRWDIIHETEETVETFVARGSGLVPGVGEEEGVEGFFGRGGGRRRGGGRGGVGVEEPAGGAGDEVEEGRDGDYLVEGQRRR